MTESSVESLPDSGERRGFETGSVRDKAEGKGRYDLLSYFGVQRAALRLEAGAKKYGVRNWEKGQPVSVFMDSGVRHAMMYLAGFTDEDHLGAAIWNLMAAAEMEGRVGLGQLPASLLDLPRHAQAKMEPGPTYKQLTLDDYMRRVDALRASQPGAE